MRSRILAAVAVVLAGCSLALDPGHLIGHGSGDDGGTDGGSYSCNPDGPVCMLTGLNAQMCCNPGGCQFRAADHVFDCVLSDCAAATAALMTFCNMPPPDGGMPPMDMSMPIDMSMPMDGFVPIDMGTFCHSPSDCPPMSTCNTDGTCTRCDADGDSFINADTRCDSMATGPDRDCDDTLATVHPGAPAICGDGVENSCHRTATGTPDWDALFSTLRVGEIGPIPPVTVITPAGGVLGQLSVVATYPSAPAAMPTPNVLVGYLSGTSAFLTEYGIDPSITTVRTMTLAAANADALDIHREARDTAGYALATVAGTSDTVQTGRYVAYTGVETTIGATTLANGVQRFALSGGFSYADGSSYPLQFFARTFNAGLHALNVLDAMSPTPSFSTVSGGDMFTGGIAFFGTANGYVVGPATSPPTDLLVGNSSVGVAPVAITTGLDARIASDRPAIAAASGAFALVVYGSLGLTGGAAGMVLVPFDGAGGSLSFMPAQEFPTPLATAPTLLTATDMASSTVGSAVAVGDFELVSAGSSRHVVRFFGLNGTELPTGRPGDAAFLVPQIPAGTTVDTFDDSQISSAYAFDGSQAVIASVSTFTTGGMHGMVVGGLRLCHSL